MKKILALVLTLSMMLALAACGGQKETNTKDPASTDAPAAGEKGNTASGDPYYIGMYAILTGSGALVGDQQVKGAQVAVEMINKAGGVQGRPVELVLYDDAGTPEGAVKAVTKLIEVDKVDVIAGGTSSPNIIATAPQTEAAGILQVGVGTGATWTNAGYNGLFRATTNSTLFISTFVDKMVDMGEKTTALISLETEYGQSGRNGILEALAETDIKLLADVTYQSTETDFTGHIFTLLQNDPDSIIVYGNSFDFALIVKQLRQNGYTKNVYTAEGAGNEEILNVAGDACNGLIFSCAYVVPESPEEAVNDVERTFLENYVSLHGEMPINECAYRGFDQLMLICEALNTAEDYTDRASIVDAFRSINGYIGLGGEFDFTDGSGDGLKSSNMYMILDQKMQAFDRARMDEWRAENIQ